MKEILKRGFIGFAMSALIGTAVNLIIDIIANAVGAENFISMSPEFRSLFPTPVIAAYVNVFLYGIIGATFSVMSFIYDVNKLGVVLQNIIYFLVTAPVAVGIAILIWQLHHYPEAIISTIAGYGLCYLIIGILQYRKLKDDIRQINEELE
ncbi:MAG: DUF3021 domain-containing protein [Eubacterium sp.]|nr:DUF3021 domain-containing protein [Eubacterium sp.]MBP3266721.1 DUF3021 domain-containing protein [Ruminococcus sp.]